MVKLVTFLAGLHHSRFRSLSVVPLLQTTDPFCTSAAILHCLKVTINFRGKSLHVLIFKRLFFSNWNQKEGFLHPCKRGLSGENWQKYSILGLTGPWRAPRAVLLPAPGISHGTWGPSSPDLTVIPWVVYFVASVCRNHTTHWASWHIVKALLMSK